MFSTIFGLPFHPLIVHATVVIVPSAALAVALAAVWPRFRRWAGFLPLLLSVVAVGLIPLSTSSGEALEHRLPHSDLIERHAHLADGLLLPAVVMLVGAAALFWISLKERTQTLERATLVSAGGVPGVPVPANEPTRAPDGPSRAVMAVAVAVALIGVLATTVQVARIGHSGAEAAWSDVGQAS